MLTTPDPNIGDSTPHMGAEMQTKDTRKKTSNQRDKSEMAKDNQCETHQQQNHCNKSKTKQKVLQTCGEHMGTSP
jgi:hypothetical protein